MHRTIRQTTSPRVGASGDTFRQIDQRDNHCLPDDRSHTDLKLEFRGVRLDTVLDYFHESAGLIIHVKPDVSVERKVDLWRGQPVSKAEALVLLNEVLSKGGCTLIQKGSVFSVVSNKDLKKQCIPLPVL